MTAVERIARELSRWIEDGPFEDVEPEARRILDLLEPEVRERERAAFVAGANFDAECEHDGLWDGGGDFEKIMDEEAFRRYPKEEKA
ncbi:MAG: hypothetical protein ABFD94_11535 [Armatimonadia bacterium]